MSLLIQRSILASSASEEEAAAADNDGSEDSSKTALDYFSIVMSNLLLFFLIFGLSATVDVRSMRRQLRNKFAIGTGVAMQFLIMPVLGFLAVLALRKHGFTKAMGITLLVVTASPGGSYSNWWCSTFNADLALSVAMTSISSLLSVAMLPANLFLYTYLAYGVVSPEQDKELGEEEGQSVIEALDFKSIFITLGVVMAAILVGLVAGYQWDYPLFHVYANRFGTVCGILLILFSVFLSSGTDGAESSFWSHPWAFYVGVASPCLVGISLANIISRSFKLSKPECVAISIECCYQNVAIATSVAISMFSDPNERAQAVSVPLFYGVVEAVIIGLYCICAWKMGWTKAPCNENLCVVISKTYEVTDDADFVEDHEHARNDGLDGVPLETTVTATDSTTFAVQRNGSVTERDLEQVGQREKATRAPPSSSSTIWTRIFPAALVRWVSPRTSRGAAHTIGLPSTNDNDDESKRNRLRQGQLWRNRNGAAAAGMGSNRCRLVSEDNTASTSGTAATASSPGKPILCDIGTNDDGNSGRPQEFYEDPGKRAASSLHCIEEGEDSKTLGSKETHDSL